uniref:Uncharacterized protein n=1 Tax=Anguilla anguilla TaxID=7936 RepID=A0A0E9WU64_ANGAN
MEVTIQTQMCMQRQAEEPRLPLFPLPKNHPTCTKLPRRDFSPPNKHPLLKLMRKSIQGDEFVISYDGWGGGGGEEKGVVTV